MYVTSASCRVNATQITISKPRPTALKTNNIIFIEHANYGYIHLKGPGIETLTKIFIAHPENFLKLYEAEIIIKIAV